MEISKLGVNKYYGHAAIIRNYCGYSEELPLPLVIQHGGSAYYDLWEMTDEYLFDYWVWDDEVKEMNIKTRHLPPQTIHVLGAPFLYLADDFKTSLSDVERQGTIAFPNHSSPCTPAIQDFQEYASQLEALPDKFHPISVCLHPYDICLGLHIPFQEKGFTVISCVPEVITYYQDIVNNKNSFWYLYGQSYTPSYLTNFINYCADKKYATGNFWTTPACYSIYLGLQFFLYGNKTKYEKGEYLSSSSEEMEYYRRIEAILSLTKDDQVADPQAQWEIASTKLGIKHKMGKIELYTYLTNLYNSRPYVEGLRQKFALLEQTESQVQTLQVELQQSTIQVEEVNVQLQKIESEKDCLQFQLNQVQQLKEICQFVLNQTQSQFDHYYAGSVDEKNQPNIPIMNSDIDVLNQSFDEDLLSSHKQALEIEPTNPLAYHRLGQVLIKLGYLEEGISCYNHALSLDRNIDIVYSDLAEAMVKVGNLEKAIIYYRRAINLKLFKDKINTE
ncbi:MAG: tetratricopeptide repeat protein [Microcoleus sp. PH2017_29_MFU_D_A]|uniref:tetratricopeptide repeat protein n=1 Tax=unclassified Microcoleus TaxID=2642155 RepID=UPI001D40BB89|nr:MULTISPECIES: tetratricopeptide repeat protein [unclassified Microcoleus]MCC3591000.1 tetratricopeptide repeat protein [Microcoleus sp. PH2017_28_MFU_U_A]MCC3603750.1 tetratricopeptide repeat protein [Microcoleus sp. PH2017_29_MFU_D_A]MCC3634799.1 tetratricopeptide repeat protein [Microcoleus sp. PH2017_37_MFU_D_B]